MEHDDEMVGIILSRREALLTAARAGIGLAALGAALGLPAAADPTKQIHLVASPELTEGPFFVDEKLKRSDLVAGYARPSVKEGLPLLVTFTLFKVSGSSHVPLKGAHIDVWHADAIGVYSDESNPMNHEDTTKQTWLRGYQITDSSGTATFKTIFPGWYPGRCPHVHFKVRTYSGNTNLTADFTSQLFFRDEDSGKIYTVAPYSNGGHDTTNDKDGVYNAHLADGTMAGAQMLMDLKKAGAGYSTTFNVVLTDQNLRAGRRQGGPGGAAPGGFGRPGGPGGPPPPPGA